MAKVFHVSEEIHRQSKDYCVARGLNMKTWVESVVSAAMSGVPVSPARTAEHVVVELQLPATTTPVAKKTMTKMEESTSEDEPWAKPPFWSKP